MGASKWYSLKSHDEMAGDKTDSLRTKSAIGCHASGEH